MCFWLDFLATDDYIIAAKWEEKKVCQAREAYGGLITKTWGRHWAGCTTRPAHLLALIITARGVGCNSTLVACPIRSSRDGGHLIGDHDGWQTTTKRNHKQLSWSAGVFLEKVTLNVYIDPWSSWHHLTSPVTTDHTTIRHQNGDAKSSDDCPLGTTCQWRQLMTTTTDWLLRHIYLTCWGIVLSSLKETVDLRWKLTKEEYTGLKGYLLSCRWWWWPS